MGIGTFDRADTAVPMFAIELLVQSQDIQDRWQRCNMLANYIAEYVAYQFPERDWAENLLSTVTNEFLEAIASLSPERAELTLRCTQFDGNLMIEIKHSLHPHSSEPYLTFLRELAGAAIDDIYFGLLTATERPEVSFNQFGLAMLVHDFHARIAAQLDDATGQICIQVDVPTKEILA
jgi:hypothetical protein